MKTGRYSLKELLTHNEIDQIIIPEIQRDYVWQPDNVEKLIRDILKKYEEWEKHSLKIVINGKVENNASVTNYLSREYERLKYKQKLGFIYAYHDLDYAGKFFLIDGQQRITTLFLLLVFLYKSLGENSKQFIPLYFSNRKLKLDYRVREQSHDFLKLFVESEIGQVNFLDSIHFYQEYYKDTTIANLILNYKKIEVLLTNHSDKVKLLDYIEDFVEVNYFDTHLSDQGEQLYIYMNSRGEQLSHQEILRAELMKKIENVKEKLEMGNLWECWQNYFWRHRGPNENADNGFEEFLKWATILHISSNITKDFVNFLEDKRDYTQNEIKEFYIKNFKDPKQSNLQKKALMSYQIEFLHFQELLRLFSALQFLFASESVYIPKDKTWLSEVKSIGDYTYILPLLQYISQIDEAERKNQLENIERVAMFLWNMGYFEHVSKNPDSSTIELIQLVSRLKNCDLDILSVLRFEDKIISDSILTNNEKAKLKLFQSESENRRLWEEFFWNLTLDEELSKFILGDSTVFFNCREVVKNNETLSQEIIELNEFARIIKHIFLENRDSAIVRLLVLCNYDYLIECGSGGGITKYSLIKLGGDFTSLRDWKELFTDSRFAKLLNWMKQKNEYNLKELFEAAKREFDYLDYREAFIHNPGLLAYCKQKKILWESEHRIVLLSQTNYSATTSREIQAALLVLDFKHLNMWIHENNCCVLDFDYNFSNNNIVHKKALEGEYAIDIVYDAINLNWSFTVFSRIGNNITTLLNDNESDWKVVGDRITLVNPLIPHYDTGKTLLENNAETVQVVNDILLQTAKFFKTAKND